MSEMAIASEILRSPAVSPRPAAMPGLSHGTLAERLARTDVTLPQLLRYRAQTQGDELALRKKDLGIWRRYTWAHYFETSCRVALGLRALGLRAGDRIAIASENTPEWFYADIGAEANGAIVVGIYPTNPWTELAYIVGHSEAKIVFTGDQEQTDKILEAMASPAGLPHVERVVCVDMKGMRGYTQEELLSFDALLKLGDKYLQENPQAASELDATISSGLPDDCNVIIYTSGTTGQAKGAMLSHRNIVASAYWTAEARGLLGHRYESVCYLPLCHVAERCNSVAMQLVVGGCVNFAECIDTALADVREIAPLFFIGVPRIYEKLQQEFLLRLEESGRFQRWAFNRALKAGRALSDRRQSRPGRTRLRDRLQYWLLYWFMFRNIQRYLGLDRTRHRICGAASVAPEMLRFYDTIGLPLAQGYGLTESAGQSFLQRRHQRRIGAAGSALRNVEWRVAADGELLMRGPVIFKGYFRDADATAKTISADGWLATGDIVEVLDDGEIAIVDRKKAIIITSGGKNIAPSRLENALKASPYIREAIVVGEGRKFLGALIQIDLDTVGRWARERGIAYTTFRSLALLPEVKALVQGVVDAVNSGFARVENIRRFVLLDKELDHDDGELTATQKVRRMTITAKFAKELVEIYGE